MKNTKDKEANIAYKMGQSWGYQILAVFIGILFTMLVVWITLPSPDERLINKACFRQCKVEIDNNGYKMSILSGPAYIDAMKHCHAECVKGKKQNDAN